MKRYPLLIASVLVFLALLWILPGAALAYGAPTAEPTPAPQTANSGMTLRLPIIQQAPLNTPPSSVVPADGKWTGYLDDTSQYYVTFSVLGGGATLDLKEIYVNFKGECDVDAMKYELSSLPSTTVENGAFTFLSSGENVFIKVTGVFLTPNSARGTYKVSVTRPPSYTTPIIITPCTYTATGDWVSTGP